MVDGHLPAVIFSEEYDIQSAEKEIKIHKYKIKEFFGIQNDVHEIHLDYGIIYS